MVLEYNAMQAGLSLAPLSLSMFAWRSGREEGGTRRPSRIIRLGSRCSPSGSRLLIPIVPRADSGWCAAGPLLIAGSGWVARVQLNNYTLAPISRSGSARPPAELGRGRSGCRSAGVRRRHHAGTLSSPSPTWQKQHRALPARAAGRPALEDDAEMMSKHQLKQLKPTLQRSRTRSSGLTRMQAC
jgi:hypothetical protein